MANILAIRFSAFGDVAMLVPVVYSAAKTYPDDTFFVLTNKAFASLFDVGLPNLKTIGVNLNDFNGVGGLFALGRYLKSYSIDCVADTHDVLRSQFLRKYFLLHGKRVRHIDKGRNEKRAIISHKTSLHPLKSTIDRYRDVFSALGYPFEMCFTSLFDAKPSNLLLPESLLFDASRKNIGIAPFAKYKEKTYPPEKMEKVIALLSQKNEVTIYLFGGKEDADVLNGWAKCYPNIISVFGKGKLDTELKLISELDVMISMDSANMHLASLTGTPVVSIWGATHPYLGFYGFNQSYDNAVQTDLDCRPCSVFGNKPCARGDWACMEDINPETVVEKVLGL